FVHQLQSVLENHGGLPGFKAAASVVRRKLQVLDGTRPVATLLEVIRKLSCDLCLGEDLLQLSGFGQTLMQFYPSNRTDSAIYHLAVQCVDKFVTRGRAG